MSYNIAKYLTQEDHLQANCMKWLLLEFPGVPVLHAPNEGKRSRFEQMKMNYIGKKQSKGFPDICIFRTTKQGLKGVAIELKVKYASGQKNYPTKEQKQWLERLKKEGWACYVCYSFDEFEQIIKENYLHNSAK